MAVSRPTEEEKMRLDEASLRKMSKQLWPGSVCVVGWAETTTSSKSRDKIESRARYSASTQFTSQLNK